MFKNRPRLMGFLVGLAITFAGCAAFILYNRSFKLELMTLDARFSPRLSTVAADPRIVHVDIDDKALDRVGRWPWPRDKTAAIVRVLHELGAKAIAIDLLFGYREIPAQEDPSQRDADIEESVEIIGEAGALITRQADDELADAIRSAGIVLLSVHTPGVAPNADAPEPIRIETIWRNKPEVAVNEVVKQLGLEGAPLARERVVDQLNQLRARELLLSTFTLTEVDLASRLGLTPADVARAIATAKRGAARQRVEALLRARPDMKIDEVRRDLLGEQANARTRDAQDVADAFRHVRSLLAVMARCPPVPPEAGRVLYQAHEMEPPLFYFTNAALDVGSVNFDADVDGAVRSVPAVVEYDGRLIKHLGLAVACHLLGIRDDQIRINADRTITLTDPQGGAPYVLPLDGRGRMLIHWTKNARDWLLGTDFKHITAASLWSICDARRLIEDNERAIGIHMVDVVGVVSDGKDLSYRQEVSRRNALSRAIHAARLRQAATVRLSDGSALSPAEAQAERTKLNASILQREAQARSFIEEAATQIRDELKPEEIETGSREAAILEAEKTLSQTISRLTAANVKLQSEIDADLVQLAPHIKDKVVFLGYAATALGDIVATPIDPRTHGVMCHAHVLNTILSRRFMWRTPRPIEFLAVLALGALISFVTATRAPKTALAATGAILILYTAVCCWVFFRSFDRWMVLAGPLFIFFLTWAFVTLFRQLTAERERRIFAKQLGQYTSPAIAARLAADPEAAAAFKSVQSRDITVLFTDLANFTTISENQDAETIQYVLNTYLKRMSEVIWRRRGLINKFMGDGVMAFFNPSVDPQPDHARVAVEVTLDGFDEMEKIKVEEANGPYRDLFARLGMRAGIATGVCKNGDFGSELKADYTVIGDVVNLAARLEPANKVFGTRLIVPEATRERVKDLYDFRYLAELQVKGKTRTVPVYEVLGRKGTIDAATLEYAARFEAGVALYRERKWDDCIRHFMRILARRPDDLGASRYIDACEELKSFPPPESWAGALELKEK